MSQKSCSLLAITVARRSPVAGRYPSSQYVGIVASCKYQYQYSEYRDLNPVFCTGVRFYSTGTSATSSQLVLVSVGISRIYRTLGTRYWNPRTLYDTQSTCNWYKYSYSTIGNKYRSLLRLATRNIALALSACSSNFNNKKPG